MSQDALSEEQFEGHLYHGTVEHVRGAVTPLASRKGGRATFPSDTDPEYAYATKKPEDAWNYAEKAWHASDRGHPRVFKVKPRGPVEKDPAFGEHGSRSNYEGDVRSKHGFDVVSEEQMPEHMGTPEEW